MSLIDSLLIANRGEIACRIARTCRRLGIRPIGIYAEDDRASRHVRELGEAGRVESYLDMASILAVARRAGAQAVHPGYGFLSEKVEFARAVGEAGLIFIGPSPEAMEALGDKQRARALCGLPVLPGGGPDEADAIGYPLMVKAAHGGGGRGMRRVERPEDLPAALDACRRESRVGFASEVVFLERALDRPRHIEVQILGDRHGDAVALGERDCSVQRRFQKLIEEAPAPGLSPALRTRLHEAAVSAARSVGYQGAGTVEFLVSGEEFYFLEMNARLQVEHPVTEEVFGLDLVEWQVRIAEGERVPQCPPVRGHCFEVRLCAEDSRTQLATCGEVLHFESPAPRLESAIETGDVVGSRYDSMLAKLIVSGPDRPRARRALSACLADTVLLGFGSNLELLRHLVDHPEFAAGAVDTGFIERHPLPPWAPPGPEAGLARVLAAEVGPGWRNLPGAERSRRLRCEDGSLIEVSLGPEGLRLVVPVSGGPESVGGSGSAAGAGAGLMRARLEGDWLVQDDWRQRVLVRGDWVYTRAETRCLELVSLWPERSGADTAGSLRTPMPGQVTAVLVEVGEVVTQGQPLIRIEAMKMEHTVCAPRPGTVESLAFAVGDQVGARDVLVCLGD